VGGEGGVGKSRLTDELRAEALVRGVLVVRGQEVADGGLPYQAWRDPARRLCLNTALSDLEAGILKAIVPDIATLLERPIPDVPELPGPQGQQRLMLSLVQLFKRQTQPVLLLLEDLHWSADSLAPLRQMQAVRDQLPHLLMIGTYRDDERPSLPEELNGVSVLRLSRLNDEAVVQLAQSMLGDVGKHPKIVNLLRRETEGNAFFMVETVRALAEDAGALSAIDVHALPSSVYTGSIRRIVQRYLSRMPETYHPLLKRAAIAGRAFDPNIVAGDSAVFEAFVEAGANARIFEISDGVWRFSHDKLREGVIAQLTPDERREQHQAVAEAIERSYPHNSAYNEALLEHWQAANNPARELEYIVDVVRLLIEVRADYERANSLIQRGLSLLQEGDPRIADLLILNSTRCERKSEIPEAKRWATQALEFARQHGLKAQMAESLFNLGKHERDSGEYRTAYDYFQQSLAIYQELDDLRGIADNLNGLGLIRHEEGDYVTAEDYYQRSLMTSQKIGYQQGIARAFNNLGRIASAHGEIANALGFFQQTQDIFRTIGDKWRTALSLNNIAVMLLNLGKADEARTSLEEALSLSREIGDKRLVATSLLNLGENAQAQGKDDAAVIYFTQSLDLFRQLEDRLGTVLTLELMAVVQLDKQSAAALPTLLESLTASLSLQSVPRILAALLLWARLLALLGKPIRAAEVGGLVAAHPGTEAETHEKGVVKLKAKLSTVLSADVFEAAWKRGAALELEATAHGVVNYEISTRKVGDIGLSRPKRGTL
jgi:tetratricopeptide (TPR) repeat protein